MGPRVWKPDENPPDGYYFVWHAPSEGSSEWLELMRIKDGRNYQGEKASFNFPWNWAYDKWFPALLKIWGPLQLPDFFKP